MIVLYLGKDCHCCNRKAVRYRPEGRQALICGQCDLSGIVPRPWHQQKPPPIGESS